MSWSPLSPPRNVSKGAVVTVAGMAGGRYAPSLILRFRITRLEGCDFLGGGAAVKIMLGGGEHMGMLRITPDGPFSVRKPTGKGTGGDLVSIRLDLPDGVVLTERRKPEVVEYDYADGWLELTLPDWAWPRPPVAKPPAPAAGGYVPVSNRTPDPASSALAEQRARR